MKKSWLWAAAGMALTLIGYLVDGKTQDEIMLEMKEDLLEELNENYDLKPKKK